MVDVSEKSSTHRQAVAHALVRMQPSTLAAIQDDAIAKGSVLATARIAGVLAAKRTADLIPLCHSLGLDHIDVQFSATSVGLALRAVARCQGRTGVEMEALTAACVAALTVYDMVKAIDKAVVVDHVHLATKSGGKSGEWEHPRPPYTWPTDWR